VRQHLTSKVLWTLYGYFAYDFVPVINGSESGGGHFSAGFFALSRPATKEEQLSGERAWRHNLKISIWSGPLGAGSKRDTSMFVTCNQ
jgi:hypothetical protein